LRQTVVGGTGLAKRIWTENEERNRRGQWTPRSSKAKNISSFSYRLREISEFKRYQVSEEQEAHRTAF